MVCAYLMLPDPTTKPPGSEASRTNSVPDAITPPMTKPFWHAAQRSSAREKPAHCS
jgi:hypothetical protein